MTKYKTTPQDIEDFKRRAASYAAIPSSNPNLPPPETMYMPVNLSGDNYQATGADYRTISPSGTATTNISPETWQNMTPDAASMSTKGRGADTMVAHVTPGDYVIPKDIITQHPDFLVKLKKVMGDQGADYRTHMVGSGFENVNPNTGAPEFGFGSIGRAIGGAISHIPVANQIVGGAANALKPLGNAGIGGNFMGSYYQGLAQGAMPQKYNAPAPAQTPYSPSNMALPSSLQELGGLTDQQRRSYLATQGSQGEGLGGSAKEYYANLLQRNIQSDQGALLPVESQYLGSQGINTSLSGQSLIDALRGF